MRRHLANHDHECECGSHHLLVIDFDPLIEAIEDKLKPIRAELRKLGKDMATATEQLTALSAKVDDLVADVRAALAVINGDTLSTEAQAALDGVNAKLDAFDAEVGDADGSDTQPV
jgi:hypothetical protein